MPIPVDTIVNTGVAARERTPAPALDPTAMAIDECTWPRGSNRVLGLDPASARAAEEPTSPLSIHDLIHIPPVPPTPPSPPSPPTRAPRYELGALLGRGGMGEVHAAYDRQIGRQVAIKRLHTNKITPGSLARFAAEARIQGWLDHPAIPSVYELGSDDEGRPFFVMKRLSGLSLEEILADRESDDSKTAPHFTEQQLLRAFVEICLAVEFAHTRGVVHRDLKPANMLLGEFGEVYVLDWGVAHVADRNASTNDSARHQVQHAPQTAGALGTPGYMSPEQVSGETLDGRADVYSLGCVLFEILVGRRLHPSGFAGMTSALAGVAASPASFREDLAPELDELCRRATAADRTQRIPSARALAEAIQHYLDGDRDLALRRRLAHTHFETAYRSSKQLTTSTNIATAIREANRALALDPSLPGAAELVSHLMQQRAPSRPSTANDDQRHKASLGIYAGYAALAPLLLAFGIRDAFYLTALVVIAAINMAIAWRATSRPLSPLVAAIGHAAMVALLARMFTPLLVAPAMIILPLIAQQRGTRLRWLPAIAASGVLAAELCGLIGATTFVDAGSIRLVPPLDGAGHVPIAAALGCYVIAMVGVAISHARTRSGMGSVFT